MSFGKYRTGTFPLADDGFEVGRSSCVFARRVGMCVFLMCINVLIDHVRDSICCYVRVGFITDACNGFCLKKKTYIGFVVIFFLIICKCIRFDVKVRRLINLGFFLSVNLDELIDIE